MKKLEWNVITVKLSDLKPLEKNPFGKIGNLERNRLRKKLEKLGSFDIPTIDTDKILLTFNKRHHILMEIWGPDEKIHAMFPSRELTEEERKEIILSSNIHEGEWIMDILDEDFFDVDFEDIGLDMNFDVDDIVAEEPKERKKSEKKELKDYAQTHVLISFPPEKLLDIQDYLEKIKEFEFVEYEQSSN